MRHRRQPRVPVRVPLLVRVAVLGGLVAACSGASPATPVTTSVPPAASLGTSSSAPVASADRIELVVYGAASLKGVLEEAAAAYQATHPGLTITLSTDSSATLATQIEQGAPADVFLSADTTSPQRLVDGGYASGEPVAFAANELAVIVPAGNPAGLASPADLARPGVKVIAAGDDVPITTYAAQLVANLATVPDYPAGFAAAYAANVVSREDNVKAVVAKVELGEGDAGIVYATDAAAASDGVETLAVPDGANIPATYAGVAVQGSAHPDAAAAFLDWFAGPAGRAILEGFGFLPAP